MKGPDFVTNSCGSQCRKTIRATAFLFCASNLFSILNAATPPVALPEFIFQGGHKQCIYALEALGSAGNVDRYAIGTIQSKLGGELMGRNQDGSFGKAQVIELGDALEVNIPTTIGVNLIKAEVDPKNKSVALYFPSSSPGQIQGSLPKQISMGKSSRVFFRDTEWARYQAGEEVEMFLDGRDFNLDFIFAQTLSSVSGLSSTALGPKLNFDFSNAYKFSPDGSAVLSPPADLPQGFKIIPRKGSVQIKLVAKKGEYARIEIGPVQARVEYENPALIEQRRVGQYKDSRFSEYLSNPDALFEKSIDVSNWSATEVKQFLLFLRENLASVELDQKSGGGVGFGQLYDNRAIQEWVVTEEGVRNLDYQWQVKFSDVKSIKVSDINGYMNRQRESSAQRVKNAVAQQRVQTGDFFDLKNVTNQDKAAFFKLLLDKKAQIKITYIPDEPLLGPPEYEGTVESISTGGRTVTFLVEEGFGSESMTFPFEKVVEIEVLPTP